MHPVPSAPLETVVADAQRIFGSRLEAVVSYGREHRGAVHSLVLVSGITVDDLGALAAAAPRWHAAGAATPLVLPRPEFVAALDAFPMEYGEIIDTHELLFGRDPFVGIRIDPADARRALELRAASHVLHLRENYIEHAGRPAAIDALVRGSAPGFAGLLSHTARLDGQPDGDSRALAVWATARIALDPRVVGDLFAIANEDSTAVDAVRLFPAYLDAASTLLRFIDQWSAS
jgi:hypothetical protein